MKVSAILFDLDGTLVNTEPCAVIAVIACFKDWGLEFPLHDSPRVMGRTWKAVFAEFKQEHDIPVSVDEACDIVTQRYLAILKDGLTIIPGSQSAVRVLAETWPLGLVTGSTREEIKYVGERLGILDQFKIILSAEEYARSKPAPDGFLKAAGLLGVDPAEVLVFEDSPSGIQSAQAAGMKVVAVGERNDNHHGNSAVLATIPTMELVNVEFIRALESSSYPGPDS